MFDKILIANRGEIACRIIHTARRMGIATVAIYSDADRDAVHAGAADEAVRVGPAPASESYLVAEVILDACRATGADAVHPGYGFLSERAAFCTALEDAGITFIGPKPRAIEAMGDKITSKRIAAEAGVSTVPGFMGLIDDEDHAARIAGEIGYPVMIKASAGGGGKGMRIAYDEAAAREGFARSRSEAVSAFGDGSIFIESFVEKPRHVEIQVLADAHGNAIHLGERECSIQRRNQKVVEEAPSPFVTPEIRAEMGAQAVALARAVDYQSAGTVEFIADPDGRFYFLEMNTRLQVEHPVTELTTGIDLVEQMIRVAAGEPLALTQADIAFDGWAVESRLYAEDPHRDFLPSTGRLSRYRPPPEGRNGATTVRNDTGVTEGSDISPYYDPMIAKLCTHAPDRTGAIDAMADALDAFEIEGIAHNLPFLADLMQRDPWRRGDLSTNFIAEVYPDGFAPAAPNGDLIRRFAAVAMALTTISEARSRATTNDGPVQRTVVIDGQTLDAALTDNGGVYTVRLGDGDGIDLATGWRPGLRSASVAIGDRRHVIRVDRLPGGFRLRQRGADLAVRVYTRRVAELARLMPVKVAPDTSNLLTCPMPGVVVALDVAEGDEVQEGQAVAVVEAMKMENVLKAARHGRVKAIRAKPGDRLSVDDVIMEFET